MPPRAFPDLDILVAETSPRVVRSLQFPDRTKFEIAIENVLYLRGFVRIDEQAAVANIVTEWRRPPIHIPLRLDAATLSRIRSPMISRSNCANESRTLRVSRPSRWLC